MALISGTSAVDQLPDGLRGDRFGEQIVLTASMVCLLIGLTPITASRSLIELANRSLRIRPRAFAPLRFTSLSDIYPDREKTPYELTFAINNVCTTGAPIVMGELAAVFFWRLGIGFALPAVLVLVIAFNSQTITFSGMAFVSRSPNEPSNHNEATAETASKPLNRIQRASTPPSGRQVSRKMPRAKSHQIEDWNSSIASNKLRNRSSPDASSSPFHSNNCSRRSTSSR